LGRLAEERRYRPTPTDGVGKNSTYDAFGEPADAGIFFSFAIVLAGSARFTSARGPGS
jgi:hypothetical protein